MFNTLVESNSKKARRTGGTILSFIAHYGLVMFAIYTSANAATTSDGPRVEEITYVDATKDVPPAPEPPPPEIIVAPLPSKTPGVLVAPVEVPTVLPEIDLRARPTDPNDFNEPGLRPQPTGSAPTVPTHRDAATNYSEYQVEKAVMQAHHSAAPVYPDILRQAGVEGEVLVSFVVDTAGRVDAGSFKVIRTTHDLFAGAVKNVLPRLRFIPAEIGSRKVRQLVQQPFAFAIVK